LNKDLEEWSKEFAKVCNETDVGKNLMKLEIELASCEGITDAGVKSLSEQIGSNFINLASFSLDLGRCERISDGGINSLCEHFVTNVKKMSHLHLNFNRQFNQ